MVLVDERVVVPVPVPTPAADVLTMAEDDAAVTGPLSRSTARRRLAGGGSTSSASSAPSALWLRSWAWSRATHFTAAARAVRVAVASATFAEDPAAHACSVAALCVSALAKAVGSRWSMPSCARV